MGDMADYYREQEEVYGKWPDADSFITEPRVTRASKWKTRSGQKIAIRDMTTEHLANILKMYEQGRLQMPDAWIIVLEREMGRR